MSQAADYNLENQSGAAFRAELNAVLAAVASLNSGDTEPSTTYAHMLWMDTANNVVKKRNAANDGWVILPIDPTTDYTALANTVSEGTAGSGVAIDGLTIKDAGIELGSDADGDLYYRDSGALARLGAGSEGDLLTMVSGSPAWAANSALVPSGAVMAWPTETAPSGWLECNGQSLLRTTYADLFTAIGTTYGAADGSHFYIPDYRGLFLRGWDHSKGNDPDAGDRGTFESASATGDHVPTFQNHELYSHKHDIWSDDGTVTQTGSGKQWPGNTNQETRRTQYTGGNETRPKNVTVLWIIKT